MRYLHLDLGYSIKGRNVTCFLLPLHKPSCGIKVRLTPEVEYNLYNDGNSHIIEVVLDKLNEKYAECPPSYTVTCSEEDEFKEKVGKSLARRHLIIKVLSDFNDILDAAIKVESTRLKKLVEFKKVLHNIRANTRYKNSITLERCEAEKNG